MPRRSIAIAAVLGLVAVALSLGADGGDPFVGAADRSAAWCPPDMAWVPAGDFLAGASPERLELPDFVPDIPRTPRARGVRSTSAYCIDRFEAPGEGSRPRAGLTWVEARAACEESGKRLCTEDEWTKACGGPLGWLLPYGDRRVPGVCHADVGVEGLYDKVRPAGQVTTCVSVYGVHDLEGSVSEWVEDAVPPPDPAEVQASDEGEQFDPASLDADFRGVLGGTMWPGLYGFGCQARHGHPRTGPTSSDDGWRCCADPAGP